MRSDVAYLGRCRGWVTLALAGLQLLVEQRCGGFEQGHIGGALLAALQVVVAERAVGVPLHIAYEHPAVGNHRVLHQFLNARVQGSIGDV
jgi:hypothetical protein